MNTNGIETLLEKFYEGNTSLQEEKVLRDFFSGENVPDHLKQHQPLFCYFSEETGHQLDDRDFELNLTSLITGEPVKVPVTRKLPVRSRFMFISTIAAGILLFIGLFFTLQHDLFKGRSAQTRNADTEMAYAEASGALMLVSGNLNAGLKHVARLKMVEKAMSDIQRLNKFYQVQTIIINPDDITNQSKKSK